MKKIKLTGKQLRAIGFPEGPVISVAINTIEKHYKFEKEEKVMDILKAVLASPVEYENDAVLGLIAEKLIPAKPLGGEALGEAISLNQTGIQFHIFGREHIEEGLLAVCWPQKMLLSPMV